MCSTPERAVRVRALAGDRLHFLFALHAFDTYVIVHVFLDCPQGLTFGKKCSLRCAAGAKMSGGEGSVTCEEDGKWSAQTAFCVMTCPNPVIPDHSVPLAESNCIGSKRTFSPGVSCKFRCKLGYRVKDRDDPGRRILKKRCTKSGRWTRPKCEPIVCPELTPNVIMWYNCSNGNSFGSVCTNNCPGEEVCVTFFLLNSSVSNKSDQEIDNLLIRPIFGQTIDSPPY